MTNPNSTIEISDVNALPADPLVSVYMLTYNHERYIVQAIEGVIAQRTSFPIELIIGEDCSLDRTGEIVCAYQKRYPQLIRILTSERNVGVYANGARCIKACRGKYIACCEGDDFWHLPEKLEIQVSLMEADPHMALCHTDFDRLIGRRRKQNHHARSRINHLAQGNAYIDLLHVWSIMTATVVIRADVDAAFRASQFNRSDWPFGDHNAALFASLRGSIGYIPISTATWRKVVGSASNSGFRKALKMRLAGIECKEMFMTHYPVPSEVRHSVLRESHRVAMGEAFYAGDVLQYHSSRREYLASGGLPDVLLHSLRLIAMRTVIPLWALQLTKSAFLQMTSRWL